MLQRLFFLMMTGALLAGGALAADVTLKAADGARIHADYVAVAKATRGVVLVHALGGQATDWRFTAEALNKAGLATISVDLRGHGGSAAVVAGELGEADYMAMVGDVQAAVAHLRAQGVTEVSIVGASIGANLALKVASADPAISTVVLLSPGMNVKGHDASEALGRYGARPVFMAVSKEDTYSAKTALVLDKQAKGHHRLEVYDGVGHGTKMLAKAPGLERLIVEWVVNPNQSSSAGAQGVDVGAALNQGLDESIQTTGKKLGE